MAWIGNGGWDFSKRCGESLFGEPAGAAASGRPQAAVDSVAGLFWAQTPCRQMLICAALTAVSLKDQIKSPDTLNVNVCV